MVMPMVKIFFFVVSILGVAVAIARWPHPTQAWSPSDAGQTVIASVGTRSITLRDLEQAAALPLYQADQQRHAMLRAALQDMIDDDLLSNEANRRGITVAQLLEQATQSKDIARLANLPAPVKRLSPGTAQGRADQHGLQEQRRIRQALIVALRRQVAIQITLPPPDPPRLSVSADDDPSIGPDSAPVTIVEFSDFQCPYCKLSVPVAKEILRQYPHQVKMVYRDYPGPNHPHAVQAAEAAQCAGEQGQFWDYHDLLFNRQVAGGGWDFAALAGELKLDSGAFGSCLEAGRYREEVMKDLRDGLKLGVSSTPTFFVNGRPLVGAHSFADFKAVIDPLLGAAPE
jgi:protein-disulfide isomerase